MEEKKEESKPVGKPPLKTGSINPDFKPLGSTSRIENNETSKMNTNMITDTNEGA